MTSTPGVGMRVKRLLAGDPLTSLTTKADQLAGYFRPRSFTDLAVGGDRANGGTAAGLATSRRRSCCSKIRAGRRRSQGSRGRTCRQTVSCGHLTSPGACIAVEVVVALLSPASRCCEVASRDCTSLSQFISVSDLLGLAVIVLP